MHIFFLIFFFLHTLTIAQSSSLPLLEEEDDGGGGGEEDEISFNHTSDVYNLDPVNIYLYKGVYAPIYADSISSLKGNKRGNIQSSCFQNRRFIKSLNLKCRLYREAVSYNGMRLTDLPWLFSFNPYSPIYAIPYESPALYDEEAYDSSDGIDDTYTSLKEYEKMGTWMSVIQKQLLSKSMAEYRVFPPASKFWTGSGCDNWTKGDKKNKGSIGSSDFRVSFFNIREVKCDKRYYVPCLCIT